MNYGFLPSEEVDELKDMIFEGGASAEVRRKGDRTEVIPQGRDIGAEVRRWLITRGFTRTEDPERGLYYHRG